MSTHHWVDEDLSLELADLRRSGEGQSLEYKQEMPSQARDLAKEIAAFATSNDGLILIGVADDGVLVGLPGLADRNARDDLCRRIAGVCKDINPPVRPTLLWAVEDERVVLGVRVKRGREPLYYVDSRPYIRHSSVSRPAEPGEVVDAVRSHLSQRASGREHSAETDFFSALAGVLTGALRWGDTDREIRSIKPWVDEWMGCAEQGAAKLRDLAADEIAVEKNLVGRLQSMAVLLDYVAQFTHTLGGGNDFDTVTSAARAEASALMDEVLRLIPISESSRDEVQRAIAKMARKLTEAWSRAEKQPFNGSVEDGQIESGRVGRMLMEFSYYPFDFLTGDGLTALRETGRGLVALEAERLYMDGGASQSRAVKKGLTYASTLSALAARSQPPV